jgi:DNA-binding beta-propeller fold protein YncE
MASSSSSRPARSRRWLWYPLLALALLLGGGGTWLYFAHAWVFFVSPGDGGEQLGLPITVAAGGGEPGFADGVGIAARLAKPIRLAPHGPDGIVFADFDNHAIRALRADGRVETLAGGPEKRGHEDGPAGSARFDGPHGIAVRDDGLIAVCEAGNSTVRLLTPGAGGYAVSTLAGDPGQTGSRDGPGSAALFDAPHAVAWTPEGALLVADIGNGRIRRIRDGLVETLAATAGQAEIMKWPMDLAVGAGGELWIADAGRARVGRWAQQQGWDSPFADLELAMPHGLAVLPDGALAVAEMYGHRILRIDPGTGAVSTFCGGPEPGSGEGQLRKPAAVLAHAGRLWIADLGNHRIVTVTLGRGD